MSDNEFSTHQESKITLPVIYQCYNPDTQDKAQEYVNKLLNPIGNNIEKSLIEGKYLVFDSNFECGNLNKVLAVSELEYNLYVNTDTNGKSKSQWFYFSVTNAKQCDVIKFNVENIQNYPYFIKDGMKPLVFSRTDGYWADEVNNVQLVKNNLITQYEHRSIKVNDVKECQNVKGNYYILSFDYKVKHENDLIYFAFWKPYSYTRLMLFLRNEEEALSKESYMSSDSLLEIEIPSLYYRREQLGLSLCNIPLQLITITSKEDKTQENKKPYIIITARMHSGETASSHKVECIIKFLLSNNTLASTLRQTYIFLITPMLNPDGVVLGNNRYDITGTDLNRCWKAPNPNLQPSIFLLKNLVSRLNNEQKTVSMYCDLHGHSQRLNSFMFMCYTLLNKVPLFTFFPKLFSQKCNIVKYSQCCFKLRPEIVIYVVIH